MESIHDYVLAELQRSKGHWPAVAKAAGISYRTLKKIATEESAAPRIDSLEKLEHYFRKTTSVRRRADSRPNV